MLTLRNLRKTALVLAVAGAVGTVGAAQAASNSLATVSRATRLVSGDAISGALALSHPIHVTVALKLRDQDGLRAFNAKPHQPMSRSQLEARHLPTQAQAQAVANFLKSAGFTNVSISRNRMLVQADGNASVAARAFNTSLARVRTHDGRDSFANTGDVRIPASLRGTVQAVLGLQDVHQAHIHAVVAQAQAGTNAVTGHNPLDFANIYGASGLDPATDMNVAVWGWGSMAPTLSDLTHYENDNGLSHTSTNVVCSLANGSVITNDPTCQTTDQGSIEWDLDSQDIVAMTGGVNNLTFYAAPSGNNGQITTSLGVIVDPPSGIPLATVINASFGECERFTDSGQGGDGSAQADDALFQVGLAQGQTFSVSTGDAGYNNCGDKPAKDSASYPASSPYVIAVAGTTLDATTSTYNSESVWRSSGGSPSSFEPAPSWQHNRGAFAGSRGPDIAFDGDPNSGAIIYVSSFGGYVQVGGTSLSAPIFAGSWARLISNGVVDAGTAAGQQLYAFPYRDFHDVKTGNNGGFKAHLGLDWASGRGSLDLSKF